MQCNTAICLAITAQKAQLLLGGLDRRSVVSAYIFNSDGIQVGVVRGPDMFDLTGKKLYTLKGVNIKGL
jgi:hypothetical protein